MHRLRIIICLMLVLIFYNAMKVIGQIKTVEYNVDSGTFTDNKNVFPFDEPFRFVLLGVSDGDRYGLEIFEILGRGQEDSAIFRKLGVEARYGKVLFVINEFLQPNKYFRFKVNSEKILNSMQKAQLVQVLDTASFKYVVFNWMVKQDPSEVTTRAFLNLVQRSLDSKEVRNIRTDEDSLEERVALQASFANLSGSFVKYYKFVESAIGKNSADSMFVTKSVGSDSYYFPKMYTRDFGLAPIENEVFRKLELDYTKKKEAAKDNKDADRIDKDLKSHKDRIGKIGREIEGEVNDLFTKLFDSYLLYSVVVEDIESSVVDPNTNAGPYISESFGYGYSSALDQGLTYFALTFFFRPVNSSVPLSNIKGFWPGFRARVGLNVGFTLEDVSTNRAGNVYGIGSFLGNKAGLLGVGVRPYPFLKFDLNTILYKMDEPNPVVSNRRIVASFFAGISVNLNLVKLLSGQPNSFSTLKTKASSN